MKYETAKPYEVRLAGRRFDVSRISQRIACALYFAWLRFRRWRIAKEAIRHLESLEDHRLDDIGIVRSDIASTVFGKRESEEKSGTSGAANRAANACDRLAA